MDSTAPDAPDTVPTNELLNMLTGAQAAYYDAQQKRLDAEKTEAQAKATLNDLQQRFETRIDELVKQSPPESHWGQRNVDTQPSPSLRDEFIDAVRKKPQ